jgi:hypothetical protein
MQIPSHVMTGAAPWWGVPVLAGTMALLGVVVSQLTILLLEWIRSRRERLRRWDADLRQLYASYLAGAQSLRDASVAFDGSGIPDVQPFLRLHEEIELIAPDEPLLKARDLKDALLNIWSAAVSRKEAETILFANYVSAIDEFTRTARVSLGRREISPRSEDGRSA